MKTLLTTTIIAFISLFAQAQAIYHKPYKNLVTDPQGDGANIDFINFSVSNDDKFLYIKIKIAEEILLNDGHNITFEIDTDNNPETGYSINGIGAELGWFFADRQGYFSSSGNPTTTVKHNDIGFLALPTVSSSEFEMAFALDAEINGKPLFTSNTVKLFFYDSSTGGDYIPNAGQAYSYTLNDNTEAPFTPLDLEKQNPNHIRLMTYNTLFDGLIDNQRKDKFKRTLKAIKPDIITFNEAWDTQPEQVETMLNNWLPLDNKNWTCIEADNGNITCSVWEITETYRIFPEHRLTANLIDLPEMYGTDLLSVNAHFKCCGGTTNNNIRQQEADAFAAFMIDAKTQGGNFTLPKNTPVILSGDLNLVGYKQQQTTLITGDIQYTEMFGQPAPLDWDNTDLTDQISTHTDDRNKYTWYDPTISYWPGRLDYIIYTDAVMQETHSYTLDTRLMSPERLSQYGLLVDDATASDHLPKVMDFIPLAYSNIKEQAIKPEHFRLEKTNTGYAVSCKNSNNITVKIYDIKGRLIKSLSNNKNNIYINSRNFSKGMYIIKAKSQNINQTFKIIL